VRSPLVSASPDFGQSLDARRPVKKRSIQRFQVRRHPPNVTPINQVLFTQLTNLCIGFDTARPLEYISVKTEMSRSICDRVTDSNSILVAINGRRFRPETQGLKGLMSVAPEYQTAYATRPSLKEILHRPLADTAFRPDSLIIT
jgi:hypothetical protein